MSTTTQADEPTEVGAIELQDAERDLQNGYQGPLRIILTNWPIHLAQMLVVLGILVLWQLANGTVLPDYLISSPVNVAVELWRLVTGEEPGLLKDLAMTGQELVLGYLIGVIAGVAAGVLFGYWHVGAAIIGPVITAINGIPKIALAPLFLIWFGIGADSKIAIAAMTVFFIMYYNTFMGIATMPTALVDVVRVMGGSRTLIIRRVVLPQISAPLLAGLKSSVPFAMIGVIVGEFIASEDGVGNFISTATQNFEAAKVFAGIVILMVMILIGMWIVSMLEIRLLRWQRD
jgi:NitT/TauT family transport system permease protein